MAVLLSMPGPQSWTIQEVLLRRKSAKLIESWVYDLNMYSYVRAVFVLVESAMSNVAGELLIPLALDAIEASSRGKKPHTTFGR